MPSVWGIHAGKTGDAFSLFTEGGLIALGWERVPDLSQLPNDAASFREAVTSVYPEMKAGAVPVAAGQLRRFIFEMAIDDIAVFPAKEDWTFRLGRVIGRDVLTRTARFELGSAMSFFRVKRHA